MKSVSNIAKITKAMQMVLPPHIFSFCGGSRLTQVSDRQVAASKLRGADARLQAGRPFTGALKVTHRNQCSENVRGNGGGGEGEHRSVLGYLFRF